MSEWLLLSNFFNYTNKLHFDDMMMMMFDLFYTGTLYSDKLS
jgi:hypothetical protein